MLKCPNCHNKTITNFTKLKVGPVHSIKCPNCKEDLTVPMITVLYNFIHYFIVIFCSVRFNMSISILLLFCLIATLVHIFIYIKFIPLTLEEN